MTFYQNELKRMKDSFYSNEAQIRTVIGTRNYINNNLEKELNLDFLSRILFISKYHLLRLFKKYYGQTPRQYLIDRRIDKAKELLVNGHSVTETCYAIGFVSLGSFSTLFKSKTGRSPSEFQNEQLSRRKNQSEC